MLSLLGWHLACLLGGICTCLAILHRGSAPSADGPELPAVDEPHAGRQLPGGLQGQGVCRHDQVPCACPASLSVPAPCGPMLLVTLNTLPQTLRPSQILLVGLALFQTCL